ncbi:MAG TPA: response regulator [Pyrinomonadaceae bacterium]|nr:response regulator [Pyrinomonadaceae bacterium]
MGRGASEQKIVLVVDDYEEIRVITRRALESFGYMVIEASNGAEAVKVAQAESPDLILMDLSMPSMDGFAAIHQLRKLLGLRDVPVIAVSAHAAPEIRKDALALGCRDFITKPVTIELLKSAVERHLPKP